jgi:hypothetical protein
VSSESFESLKKKPHYARVEVKVSRITETLGIVHKVLLYPEVYIISLSKKKMRKVK